MAGINMAGIIMADFWKFHCIIYDNDVIWNNLAGINMAVFPKNRQIIPAILIPGKVLKVINYTKRLIFQQKNAIKRNAIFKFSGAFLRLIALKLRIYVDIN